MLAVRAERLDGVELALHHVELAVHLRQPALGLDDDQAVHAVGDVVGDARRGAVIDVDAGLQRLEGHGVLRAGLGLGRMGAAARTGRGVEVDGVHHHAVGGVLQRHLHGVADPDAQQRAGNLAVEGPVFVGGPVVELALELDGLERRPSPPPAGAYRSARVGRPGRARCRRRLPQRPRAGRRRPGRGPPCRPRDGRRSCRSRRTRRACRRGRRRWTRRSCRSPATTGHCTGR